MTTSSSPAAQTNQQGDQAVARFHPTFDLLDHLGAAGVGQRRALAIEVLIICRNPGVADAHFVWDLSSTTMH